MEGVGGGVRALAQRGLAATTKDRWAPRSASRQLGRPTMCRCVEFLRHEFSQWVSQLPGLKPGSGEPRPPKKGRPLLD